MKRCIVIETDGGHTSLELERVIMVRTAKQMINLDKMDNGKWRLVYSEGTIQDISKVQALRMLRED